MIKRFGLIFVLLAAVVLAAASYSTSTAAAEPELPAPNYFFGAITIGGQPAPDGLTVSARIGGVEYAHTTTLDGKYGYAPLVLKVPADNPATPTKDGGVDGDTVEFFLDGVEANETEIFHCMTLTERNLTVPTFIHHYTVTAASYNQSAGTAFLVTVTAYDPFGDVATWDSSTEVTMSSSSQTMVFDANGDGNFNDNVKTLSNGTFDTKAKDKTAGSGVTITATDGNDKTGTSPSFTINPVSTQYYTVTAASYSQTAGSSFVVTVTACDPFGNVVTTDSSTGVTMSSSSETMVFDADGDGKFYDNVKTLSNGTFDIQVKDTRVGNGVTITATDGNGKTGTSSSFTINPAAQQVGEGEEEEWAWAWWTKISAIAIASIIVVAALIKIILRRRRGARL